jgi:hypothetical protein
MEKMYNQAAPFVLEAFRRLSKFIKETAIPAFQSLVEYVKAEILPRLQETFNILRDMAVQITEKLGPAIKNTLVGAFDSLKESMPGTIDVLNKVLKVLEGIVATAAAALDALDRVSAGRASSELGKGIGRLLNPLGNIPGLAEGGIVTRPTLAMIGEGGQSEAVIPLDKLGKMGGGNITVNVTGGLATSADIGRAVVNAIKAMNRVDGPAQIQVA